MAKPIRPTKKTDRELFRLINKMLTNGEYVFKRHAKSRQKDRAISDLEVLDILEGKRNRNRHRNKRKNKYEIGNEDWNYCIEGNNLDKKKMRIIISFENGLIPIITVMWIE